MERGDVGAVVEIEQTEPSAWSKRLIESEFDLDNSILLVACIDICVIGWCSARFTGSEAELLKIGVAGNCRHQSVGTTLLSVLWEMLGERQVDQLLLEVRSQNEYALGFYRQLGFTPVARRINYYSQPDDDALILMKKL